MNTLEPAAQSKPPGGFKLWLSQLQMKHGRKLVIALPYIWLILLFLLPFLIVFKISLAEMARAIPPYTELMEWADGQLSITLNLGNFLQLTDDPLYFDAYLQSLQVAAISTFCCLLIGYPLAWAVAHSKPSTRNILLLLVILPSWTSFLIRVYAWMGILKNNGVLNNFLLWLGVIDQPLTILHTNLAVYIGIVYAYVPFMVLPIYTALIRIDYSLAVLRATSTSWVTITWVIFVSASSRMMLTICAVISGSSAAVGSSNSSTCGSIINARAIATRCC